MQVQQQSLHLTTLAYHVQLDRLLKTIKSKTNSFIEY